MNQLKQSENENEIQPDSDLSARCGAAAARRGAGAIQLYDPQWFRLYYGLYRTRWVGGHSRHTQWFTGEGHRELFIPRKIRCDQRDDSRHCYQYWKSSIRVVRQSDQC